MGLGWWPTTMTMKASEVLVVVETELACKILTSSFTSSQTRIIQ